MAKSKTIIYVANDATAKSLPGAAGNGVEPEGLDLVLGLVVGCLKAGLLIVIRKIHLRLSERLVRLTDSATPGATSLGTRRTRVCSTSASKAG
jgi:hypothetical protein